MSENFFIWHAYVKMFFLQCIFDSQQYTLYDEGGKIFVLLSTVWVKVYFCFTDSGCVGWIKNVGGLNDDFWLMKIWTYFEHSNLEVKI